jgi:hypothetical protein
MQLGMGNTIGQLLAHPIPGDWPFPSKHEAPEGNGDNPQRDVLLRHRLADRLMMWMRKKAENLELVVQFCNFQKDFENYSKK